MFDKKLIISIILMVAFVAAIHLVKNCPEWTLKLAVLAFLCSWGNCIGVVIKSAKNV